jgi:hypothetical protein
MIQQEGIVGNHLDSSIDECIGELPELFERFPVIWITSLDSSQDLSNDGMIKNLSEPYELRKMGAIVSGKTLVKIQELDGMFAGFDELWCFDAPIDCTELPEDVFLVGPRELSTEIPDAVVEWMRRSKGVLGLGDGIGLNYVSSDTDIAALIERTLPSPK